ncbi:MAG TPA: maleylpyruvate isomerase N-terminal domain-containing protein [Nocardioides sp.]|nr:maleylpyruvate isomerase N-terminal domain-containing protein [Nocardioides sp.]
MRALSFPHADAVERLLEQLEAFASASRSFDDLELLAPSLCVGWGRLDLLVHVRHGVAEMALGCARLTHEAPDHDAASYWSSWAETEDDPVPGILWLRRTASAYRRPSGAVAHLTDVFAAAAAAVRSMDEGVVEFQGKRMLTGDFLGTWVVELVVHQLDLDRGDAGGDSPTARGLEWTRATLEALVDADLPAELDDLTAVLVGLGRMPCPDGVELDARFPVSV